ncbi:unnamed protein product [Rotaria magnacalcarata]|uniref:Uncharacterized protein n=1 Tax=Rotaria magnacalcarata TaxID=392030 RepID=A0A816PH23_9BILA|nr:unnamed protein product [Rotaria magnacalcarata]
MASNNDYKFAVKTTINKLKDDLQNYERLADKRVKLSTDMNVFELTARKQEVEKRKTIRNTLEDEYDTSNN